MVQWYRFERHLVDVITIETLKKRVENMMEEEDVELVFGFQALCRPTDLIILRFLRYYMFCTCFGVVIILK